MKLEIKFKSESGYEYETLRTEWDRNYADKETAMVFIQSEEDDFDGYYEVNVRKDAAGEFTGGGYVCRYDSEDETEPSWMSDKVTLDYEGHDFDEVLRVANETLQPFGKRIVVNCDGEGYWDIGSTDLDGSNVDYYAEGDFEHEVARDINECLAHVLARVKNTELVKHEDAKKYTQKEMENAVMIAGDMWKRFYNAASTPGGSLEVAQTIIHEACEMEKWLTKKYGPYDEEYLDRLQEYEELLKEKYNLPVQYGEDGYFSISRLHRDDLDSAGFDASNVDDATMGQIADKMGDDYVTQLFWEHLPFFAEHFGVPQKEEAAKEDIDE